MTLLEQDGATSANEDSMWESASDEDEGGTTAADSSGIAAGPSAAGNDRQLRADAPSFHPGAAPLQPGGGTAAAAGDAAPAADPGASPGSMAQLMLVRACAGCG